MSDKIKYILVKGMLLWGGLTSFLFISIRLFEGKISLTGRDMLVELTSTVPVYFFFGICMGEIMWRLKKKKES